MTLVSSGEGATSEGEFWESLNAACLENLPLVFLVEDNGYAISVPVERQTAGGNIAQLVSGFPESEAHRSGRHRFRGLLPGAWRKRWRMRGRARVRRWCTPRSRVPIRIRSPTTSGSIRPKAERAAEEARDPIVTFPGVAGLRRHSRPAGVAVDRSRGRSGDPAGHRSGAAGRSAGEGLRAARICTPTRSIPTSAEFEAEPQLSRRTAHHGGRNQSDAARGNARAIRASSCSAKTWPIAAAKRVWRK